MGVATFQPPEAAPPDIGPEEAEYAMRELIAHVSRRCGYQGAKNSAVRRLTELVDDCMSPVLTQS